jgi:hypothetical protein
MEAQKSANSKGNTEQKEHTGGITITEFKLYYGAIAIKTTWVLAHKQIQIQMEQKTQTLIYSYNHLIFDKGTQNIPWKKDSLINECEWENWISACTRLKLDLLPCSAQSGSKSLI